MPLDMLDICDMLPNECVNEIAQSGQNDAACTQWREKLNLSITKTQCIQLLEPLGAWNREQMNRTKKQHLLERVIWLAAWQKFEDQ